MNTQHGVAATRGHLADNGGVRGHSAGDVFPFIIVGTGDDKWHVQLPDGRMMCTRHRAESAFNDALLLKKIREKMDISKMSIAHIRMALIHMMRGGEI